MSNSTQSGGKLKIVAVEYSPTQAKELRYILESPRRLLISPDIGLRYL